MTLVPVSPPPGVALSGSSYTSGKDVGGASAGAGSWRQGGGRWVRATNIEFIAGLPQKIAGWAKIISTLLTGIPRAEKIWRDNTGGTRVAIGTESQLYYILNGVLTDITPVRVLSTGTLTNPVSTTGGSNLIDIADSSQVLQNGDWVFLHAASAVSNILLNDWYIVSSRTGSGYQITFPITATTTAGPGGGTVDFQYPRVTLTNPFTTVSGSHTVTVAHTANGATAGGYVIFSGASAVGGLTLNGEFQIQTVIDPNSYTITSSTAATSSASGGGSVSVIYEIIVQQATTNTNIGYGMGAYGAGAYGQGTFATQVLANGWTLDSYGYQLLAAPIGGTIYIYDPALGGRAYPMLNAPHTLLAMFVTPERFVVALGINGNFLQMAWCDQNNYTIWTTTATNTANTGRTLIGGSYFTGGIGVRDGVSLIFSDRCAFQMNYTGGQEIYATPQIGDNCGAVGPQAMCGEGGTVYWQSDQDMWQWNGGVAPLPTDDVRAYIFQTGIGILNRQQIVKCAVVLNRAKRQVRFWFPSNSSVENNTGVIYQYDQQCWSAMGFGKACGQDAELLAVPVSAAVDGSVYYDETGVDAAGSAIPYELEMSVMDVSNGDKNMDIFGFVPDFQTIAGDTNLETQTSYYPDDTPTVSGPFVLNSSTGREDLREDGKLFGFSLSASALGTNIRLGIPRVDIQPSGARR